MPARRELHTGRYNFLHRAWGPFEPFDDSAIELLKQKGIYTHLVSDHHWYWQDGGATYHHRYNTWENIRGQERDRWLPQVREPVKPSESDYLGQWTRYNQVNRQHVKQEADTPQAKTFARGMSFLENNYQDENWFLQIETFDPHEPFFTLQPWKEKYLHGWLGPHFDWPKYDRVMENPEIVDHIRYEYAALLSQCDHYLGKVLRFMDDKNMWGDTMLIVNTDHGFLLGEHDWWAKCRMPFYNEIAHIPLFIWDPRVGKAGTRRQSLVQMIDLPPTLLDFFDISAPPDMNGRPLRPVIENDSSIREGALFGIFGGHVNVTDGRFVYMRAAIDKKANRPLFHYTHMPTHIDSMFDIDEMRTMVHHPGFSFTKGCPVMKINGALKEWWWEDFDTMLFDLEKDPNQKQPLNDRVVENRMTELLIQLMRESDSPPEQFERLGLI
jgi:arylsulfatase A-like enzyme